MGLLSKLKSMLGLEETERAPGSGVDVTVEHEPDADSERAVKEPAGDGETAAVSGDEDPVADGTGAAASTETLVDDDGSDDPDRAAEPAEAAGTAAGQGDDNATDSDTPATESDSDGDDTAAEPDDLTEIKGIGPAYAERLADAGVTTFTALADADTDELAAATDLSPKRVGRWIDRAGDH